MEEKEETRITGKQIKLVIFLILIGMVIVLLAWGLTPAKIYEVSEIYEHPSSFDNAREISVKGLVADYQVGASNFTLLGSQDANLTIQVIHDHPFPEGFGNAQTVVVTGTLTSSSGIFHIQSSAIQIGCPSKY